MAGGQSWEAARSDRRESQMYAGGEGQSRPKTQDVVVGSVDRPQHVVPSVIRRRSAVVHAQPTIGGRLPTVGVALSTVRGAVVHVAGAVVHDDDTEHVFGIRWPGVAD